MKEFPNYLMSANDNNDVSQYRHKNKSSIAFHYDIEKPHVLPRKEPEVIKTSIMDESITKRPFQPTNVPSLLKGVKSTQRINYDEIVLALSRLDDELILCDNTVNLDETKQIKKVPQKRGGLNQTMANILLNETQQVNYLSYKNMESE